MTRMSEPHASFAAELPRNRAGSLEVSALARPVHALRSLVRAAPLIALTNLGACVIPPSLSVAVDAGQNSPPAILAVRSDEAELPEQTTVIFDRGSGALSVELIDTDVDDTLQVRVFVGYSFEDPQPQRATCTAPPVAVAKRSATCDLTALCTVDDVTKSLTAPLNMSVVVFDRIPLESGTPAFQAMPEGGLSTNRFFFLKCTEMN
jgi:hypothetical protein